MRKTALCFFVLLSSVVVKAQIYTPDTNAYKSFIKIELDIEYENNAFDNEFINLIFSDEFISREIREENLKRQSVQNNFGLNFIQSNTAYLGMVNPIKNRKKYGLKVGFDWRYSLYGRYNEDLMGMVFLGNESYRNTNANLARTEIVQFNHQRLIFGIYDEMSNSYLNLGIGKGSQFTKAEFSNAEVFTDSLGYFMDLNWNGSYMDTPNPKWTDWNGTSVTADFKWNIINKPTERNKFLNILSFELSHFGFMHWNDLNETRVDTNFRFQGLEIVDFLDDSFTFPDQSALEDSIIPSSISSNYLQFMPFNVNFSAASLRQSGISYGFELDYWARMYATPNIRFQLGYLARRNFKLNTEYSIGGYQAAKLGFSFEWEINYSWYWKIGTHHFFDNINKNGFGRSIFVILKRDIR